MAHRDSEADQQDKETVEQCPTALQMSDGDAFGTNGHMDAVLDYAPKGAGFGTSKRR